MRKHLVLRAAFRFAAVVLSAAGCGGGDGSPATWSDAGVDADSGLHIADRNAPTVDAEVDSGEDATDSGSPPPVGTSANDPCPTLADIDYFVDQNDPAASDSNPGTEAAPWETLDKASATAVAGDCVAVKAGTYTETLAPANSGTAENVITFKAYPGDECKGDSSAQSRQSKTDCRVKISGASVNLDRPYLRFEGFEVVNSPSTGVSISADGVEVVNNFVHDTSGGAGAGGDICIWLDRTTSYVLVENNEVTGCGRGIKNEDGTPTYITLRGNNVWKVQDGIRGGASHSVFENNWVHEMTTLGGHRDAFDLAVSGSFNDLTIRNNMVHDFSQLIYVPGDNEPRTWENLYIYGNILFTSNYPTDPNGEAPGIAMAAYSGQTLRNVFIHSNTCGWLGMTRGGDCIRNLSGAENVVIRNNIVYGSKFDISTDADPSQISSDYNVFYSSTGDSRANAYSNEGANSIYQDPLFVDYRQQEAWDLHLQPGSPAIDQGDPNLRTLFSLPLDFLDPDGTARPEGDRCDIGAYEFIP